MGLNSNYVVTGSVDRMPSKLSESVGLRVYAKLRKPYALFFRNPSFAGLYSENLRPGEVEFIFGVKKEQVPFVGGVKVLQLVRDHQTESFASNGAIEKQRLFIRQHPDANTQYNLMSKDLTKSFVEVDDGSGKPVWDQDVYDYGDVDSMFGNLQDDDGTTGGTGAKPLRYVFDMWLEQRKKAYYEGYKCNCVEGGKIGSTAMEMFDPFTWRIYINEDEDVCFNEVKLELAREYWWTMRIGFVKTGIKNKSGKIAYDSSTGVWPNTLQFQDGANYNTSKSVNEMYRHTWYDKVQLGDTLTGGTMTSGPELSIDNIIHYIIDPAGPNPITTQDPKNYVSGNCRAMIKYGAASVVGDYTYNNTTGAYTRSTSFAFTATGGTGTSESMTIAGYPECNTIALTDNEFVQKVLKTTHLYNIEREKPPGPARMANIGMREDLPSGVTTYFKWQYTLVPNWNYVRWFGASRDPKYSVAIGRVYVIRTDHWLGGSSYSQMPVEPLYKEIYTWGEPLSEYQDYYFCSDNDDDNDEVVSAFTKLVLGEEIEYKGGIVNISKDAAQNYVNLMQFKRPFDIQAGSLGTVCDNGGYTFYKCKVIMPTPGELYYLGVLLLHKQYMISEVDQELNSDIVFIPMIARPDTPDWCDTPTSMKGFMPFQKWNDQDTVYETFTVNRMDSGSGSLTTPGGTSTSLRAIRQTCGPQLAEWVATYGAGATRPNPKGALWKIQKENDDGTSVEGYRGRPVSEGVAILSGANTRTTELGLIWSLKTTTFANAYDSKMEITQVASTVTKASENLAISDFTRYTAYIQAPYPDSNYFNKLRYIKLYRDKDYGELDADDERSMPDEDNGTYVDFVGMGLRTPPTSGNGPGQIVMDACSIAIANRKMESNSQEVNSKCINLGVIFDSTNPYYQGLLEMFSEQGLFSIAGTHIPMYENNVCRFATPLLVLADDQSPDGGAGGLVARWEQRNRMVRKFYIFWAEKEEDTFKIHDEPMDITNRDWSDAINHRDVIDRFHRDRRYVIKRFENDGKIPDYDILFERWTMVQSDGTPRAQEYVCASRLDNGTHSFDIYKTQDYLDSMTTTGATQTRLPVYSVAPAELNQVGVYDGATKQYKLSLQLNLGGGPMPAEDFYFIKTIETKSFATTPTGGKNPKTEMGYNWNGTVGAGITLHNVPLTIDEYYGTTLTTKCNGYIFADASIAQNPEDMMYTIADLDPAMNISFGLDQTGDDDLLTPSQIIGHKVQGTRHYRCGYDNRGNSLDSFLVRDSIQITDPTFLKAKQRAYCLAAICETDDPHMNYWTYTNTRQY